MSCKTPAGQMVEQYSRPITKAMSNWAINSSHIELRNAGKICRCSKTCTRSGRMPVKSTKKTNIGIKKRRASKTRTPFNRLNLFIFYQSLIRLIFNFFKSVVPKWFSSPRPIWEAAARSSFLTWLNRDRAAVSTATILGDTINDYNVDKADKVLPWGPFWNMMR